MHDYKLDTTSVSRSALSKHLVGYIFLGFLIVIIVSCALVAAGAISYAASRLFMAGWTITQFALERLL